MSSASSVTNDVDISSVICIFKEFKVADERENGQNCLNGILLNANHVVLRAKFEGIQDEVQLEVPREVGTRN